MLADVGENVQAQCGDGDDQADQETKRGAATRTAASPLQLPVLAPARFRLTKLPSTIASVAENKVQAYAADVNQVAVLQQHLPTDWRRHSRKEPFRPAPM